MLHLVVTSTTMTPHKIDHTEIGIRFSEFSLTNSSSPLLLNLQKALEFVERFASSFTAIDEQEFVLSILFELSSMSAVVVFSHMLSAVELMFAELLEDRLLL